MANTPYGFQTLDELLHYTYGRTPEEIIKSAGGIGTDTLGVYNPIYGAMIWGNFNIEANIFSCLPKYIWDYSGWRIFTKKAGNFTDAAEAGTGINNTPLGGVVEGGLIPPERRPDVQEISVRPKTVAYSFQVTEVQEHLANNARDDLWGHLGQQRVYASAQFKENLNNQLLYDPQDEIDNEKDADGNTTGTRAAGEREKADIDSRLNVESIDRIISSNAEALHVDSANATHRYNPWINIAGDPATDGAANQYTDSLVVETANISRHGANTTYDTTVNSPTGVLGTSDTMTDTVLRKFLSDIRIAGAKDPTLFFGGQELYADLQGIYTPGVRIQNPSDGKTVMTVGVNGINTFTGTGVGLHISKFYDIPFIPTKDVPGLSDTNLGSMYAIDTSDPEGSGKPRFGVRVLKPIVYYEASHRIPAYPYNTNGFVEKGVFEGLMETAAMQLKTQGKIRDIRRS